MPNIFQTEQTLWYNNGIWGQLGYAVPNFGLGAKTLNQGIQYLVTIIGRNLLGVLQTPDADTTSPPKIETLTAIHQLICRARQIMGGRAVPPGQASLQPAHVAPGVMDQIIFPVPYLLMRNQYLKEYTGLILAALGEAMQHTENRQPFDFSTDFAAAVSQLLQRVYVQMATELLQIDAKTASAPNFVLTSAQLEAYNPSAWFTSTEMIDVNPPASQVPTAIDLQVLSSGIPASKLVGLCLWPDGTPYNPSAATPVSASGAATGSSTASASASAPAATVPAFIQPASAGAATPPAQPGS